MGEAQEVLSARERQAQRRRAQILDAAMVLFQEKCVEDTSLEEVAKQAGVGVATLYRYFTNKIELVIEVAMVYWERIAAEYVQRLEAKYTKKGTGECTEGCAEGCDTGYCRLQKILDIFCQIFAEQRPFLKFVQEFDVFVKKYKIAGEELLAYESGILKLKPYVTEAIRLGMQDGSLRVPCTVDELYFSLTHTMLALMEKLAVGGDILPSDQAVNAQKQLRITTELLLRGLQNSQASLA